MEKKTKVVNLLLTGKQKSYLRSRANTMNPIAQVGKGGITDAVVTSVEQALTARELVKVTVLNNCLQPVQEIAQGLAQRTNSTVVQQLGKKIVLYRPNSQHPVLNLPE